MQKTNKRIIIVLYALVIVFIFLVLYLAYFQIVKADKIVNNEYNSRLWVDETKYIRGEITDRNGTVIAQTIDGADGEKIRNYPFGSLYCHVLGYASTDYGKTGLEQSYNKELLNITKNTPIDEIKNLVIENTKGNDIRTTLDTELQSYASELMEGHKGSVILMNPKTGEVYAMVSKPGFDPNNISGDWDNLINDNRSPLLNRSTQGLYTPGSVIKVITATAILESADRVDMNYHDEGSTVVDGYTINNFEHIAHGDINLQWALVHSSNAYFVDKALEVGPAKMTEVFNRFMFNREIPFDLNTEISMSPFKEDMTTSDLAAAAYGQGKTLVTPLNMALSISAIANEGKMVKPILVSRIIKSDGELVRNINTESLSQATSAEVANDLKEYLKTVVENYSTAQIPGLSSGGKTGTAETGSGLTHAWYVGFAPYEDPKFAVAVVLEEDGTLGGTTAAPIGARLMERANELIE